MARYDIVPFGQSVNSNVVIQGSHASVGTTVWPSGCLLASVEIFGRRGGKVTMPYFQLDFGIISSDRMGLNIKEINNTTYPLHAFYITCDYKTLQDPDARYPSNSQALITPGVTRVTWGRLQTTSPLIFDVKFMTGGFIINRLTIKFSYNLDNTRNDNKFSAAYELSFFQYSSTSYVRANLLTSSKREDNTLSSKGIHLASPKGMHRTSPKGTRLASPTIQVRASTSKYVGDDLGQIVYDIQDTKPHPVGKSPYRSFTISNLDGSVLTQISLYIPNFSSVIKGNGCELSDKMIEIINSLPLTSSLIEQQTISGRIIVYGVVRYILTWLMTDVFSTQLLLDRYTNSFLLLLSQSDYSNFLAFFALADYLGMNAYYKY